MPSKKNATDEAQSLNIQLYFFERLRAKLPAGLGMAEEVADILGISIDSAYRRIRGEKPLSLVETSAITNKYPVSVDDLLSQRSDTATFTYTKLTDSSKNFTEYLGRIAGHLKATNTAGDKKLYYVAEEMPLFYSFFDQLYADFKLFYWQRSVLNVPEYQVPRYEFGRVPKQTLDLAMSSYREYLNIPSVEIWTDRTVLTGLRQIAFYFESGVVNKEQALQLMQSYRASIEKVGEMASTGRKNISDQNETYTMYNCDLVLGTNCIYGIAGNSKYSYISFNTVNSLTTSNTQFCEETENWIRNLEKKSTLISGVAEKQRYQFFKGMFKTIDEQLELIRNKSSD